LSTDGFSLDRTKVYVFRRPSRLNFARKPLCLSNGQRVNCLNACDTIHGDHGRIRNRQDFAIGDSDCFPGKDLRYAGPETLAPVIGQRDVNGNPPPKPPALSPVSKTTARLSPGHPRARGEAGGNYQHLKIGGGGHLS
jgi:hypothetical protein